MKKALCIDLDETLLLGINQHYIPAFPRSICDFLTTENSTNCQERLIHAIHRMIQKTFPLETLHDVFEKEFVDSFGPDRNANRERVCEYYRNAYADLRSKTQPRPGSDLFLSEAIKRGYEIILATNPIYPREAIIQRLDWAGLSGYLSAFRLITTSEEFHYAKPNPAYFCEIQARCGWPENSEFIMVGDSFEQDIKPAIKAGMKAFWISPETTPVELMCCCGSGSLMELFDWEIHTEPDWVNNEDPFLNIDFAAQLYSTIAVLDHLYRNVSEEMLNFHPAEGEWSFVEILCHLRDADGDVNYPRFKEAFQNENPFLPSIDTHAWVTARNYRQENAQQALLGFVEKRLEFISLIESFPGEWWQKMARHSVFGPTSLAELLTFITTHDRIHIRQAFATIKAAANHGG